jgi:hypothetical protein
VSFTLVNPWTDKEHKRLIELVNTGATARVIAAMMGRSRSAVIGRCHRNGIALMTPVHNTKRATAVYKPRKARVEKVSTIGLHRISTSTPKPPEPPREPRGAPDPTIASTTLSASTWRQCKAVIGPVTSDSALCGAPVHAKSFCRYHHARYYKRDER